MIEMGREEAVIKGLKDVYDCFGGGWQGGAVIRAVALIQEQSRLLQSVLQAKMPDIEKVLRDESWEYGETKTLQGEIIKRFHIPDENFENVAIAISDLCQAYVATREARIVELEGCLKNLVNKLEAVHNDKQYISVWTLYATHFGNYTGLQYKEEFEQAKKALKGK